jgi:hypothetical protein
MESAAFTMLLLFAAVGPLFSLTAGVRPAVGGGAPAPGANTLLCLSAFLIATLTFLSRSALPAPRPLAVPLGAITALAFLGVLQLVPIPRGVLGAIAPANLRIYHESAQILSLYGEPAPTPRISIAPTETAGVILLVLAYAGLFVSTVSLLSSRPAETALPGSALPLRPRPDRDRGGRPVPRAGLRPLKNPDHFAGYLEIVLALAFGTLWAEVLVNRDRAGESQERGERFEKRFPAMASRVLLWGIVAAGIALTQSRGGILAAGVTTVALAFVVLLLRPRLSRRRSGPLAATTLLLGLTFAVVAAGRSRFDRFLATDPRDITSSTRGILWRTSTEAWSQFPIVGSGLGTFREAFRRVQPSSLVALVENAHNDFLQLAVTGGAVGAAAGVVLFASLFFLIGRASFRQRHREESAVALAGVGALLSLTLHGLVEFNLSVPIIPATLACALGVAWSSATRN